VLGWSAEDVLRRQVTQRNAKRMRRSKRVREMQPRQCAGVKRQKRPRIVGLVACQTAARLQAKQTTMSAPQQCFDPVAAFLPQRGMRMRRYR